MGPPGAAYYVAWVHAVQDPAVGKALADHPLGRAYWFLLSFCTGSRHASPSDQDDSPLLNNYTVIHVDADGVLAHRPYAAVFARELEPVLAAFDALLGTLQASAPFLDT